MTPRPAEAQTVVWSATLTTQSIIGIFTGCQENEPTDCNGALTDDSFTYAGVNYQVIRLWVRNSDANLQLSLDKVFIGDLADLTLIVDGRSFPVASATSEGRLNDGDTANWGNSGLSWSVSQTVSVSLVAPAPPASAGVSDPTLRSWPLTAIADEGPTEWWFPIGRGACDMKDEIRPWTWERWTPPTADQCGWLSIPDVRAGLDEPVSETAFSVYTALIASPDIGGRASVNRPRGPSVKLAVWAVYPEQHYNLYNWTRRLKGDAPLTVCLPGGEDQALHGYDEANGQWVELESVEAEREGHICGLHTHDLGLIVVAGD